VCKGLVFFLNNQIIRENNLKFFFRNLALKITPYIEQLLSNQQPSQHVNLFSLAHSLRECKGKKLSF